MLLPLLVPYHQPENIIETIERPLCVFTATQPEKYHKNNFF